MNSRYNVCNVLYMVAPFEFPSIHDRKHTTNLISECGTLYPSMVRKVPRSKMEIYFDIIVAIKEEQTNGEVKPTRIQFQSNLSYDNLLSHMDELEKIKMINKNPIAVTEKGKAFIQDYDKIRKYMNELGLEVIRVKDRQL
jgi:predicted transcriptional regulator